MNYRQPMPPYCSSGSRGTTTPMMPEPVIAMAYVPVQHFHTTYDLKQSLEVGTIFPELNLPFCGKRCMR